MRESQKDYGNDDLQVRIVKDTKSRVLSVILRKGGRFNNPETSPVYVGGDQQIFKYSNIDGLSLEYFKRIAGRDDKVEVYAKTESGFELVGSKTDLVKLCKESLDVDKKVRLYIEGNRSAETVKEEDGGVVSKRVRGPMCCFTGND